MTPSTINWHSVRTTGLIIVTLAVNLLAVFHSIVSPHTAEIFDTITPVLLYVEHVLQGNSSAPTA